MYAVYEKNSPAVLEPLLKHKADVNMVAGDGDFVFFMAAYEGYADLTRLLLDAGAK